MFKNLFILLLTVLVVSCETPVELDAFDEVKSKLSVSSIFKPRIDQNIPSNFQVLLTSTRATTSNDAFSNVTDATITLYKNGEALEDLIPLESSYLSTYEPEEGQQYALEIKHPDFGPVYAQSYVPSQAEIGSIDNMKLVGSSSAFIPNMIDYIFNFDFELLDNPKENNYYHILFYYTVLEGQSTSSGTLDEVAFLPTFNREGGYPTGAILSDSDPALYGAFIDDSTFNGETKSLSFSFNLRIDPLNQILNDLHIELRTVSEEYYKFHTSAYRSSQVGTNPFINTPVSIDSNIENGIGIFGGYISDRIEFRIPQ